MQLVSMTTCDHCPCSIAHSAQVVASKTENGLIHGHHNIGGCIKAVGGCQAMFPFMSLFCLLNYYVGVMCLRMRTHVRVSQSCIMDPLPVVIVSYSPRHR